MRTWLAAVLVTACAHGAGVVEPPMRAKDIPLAISRTMLETLAWMQRDVRTEGMLCIGGQWRAGHLNAETLISPRIDTRSDSSVVGQNCGGVPGAFAEWHPHVSRWANDCRFSDPDRESFEGSGLLFQLLGCGAGEFRIMVAGDTATYSLRVTP